jgi:carbamoyl-phosphate synthase large subunit
MTTALLVSTGTLWVGTARFPRVLARAGLEVALLTPKGALAEKSRYVGKIGHLPDQASASQWVFAFAAMVRAVSPAVVLPCDDTAFRLLANLHSDPPPGMQPAAHRDLAALIADSLGDPAHYLGSVDKLAFPSLAKALGVRVPPSLVVASLGEAEAFIAREGFPLVLTRSFCTAGEGVALCDDRAALADAFADLLAVLAQAAAPPATKLLLQASIEGARFFHPALAWRGELRVGWAAEVLLALSAKGSAAVSRSSEQPAMREQVARLARGLGIHGIFGVELIREAKSGLPYVLEINRRVSPGFHRGADFGIDLGAALRAFLDGRPSPSRLRLDDGEEHLSVNFPQEWLRDPDSPHLREYPVDVPWDDPELIEAFLAMRHQLK